MNKKNGFTLVELLVAISILGILATIGLMFYQSVVLKTKDSQRIKDLRSIEQALELYRGDVHSYPVTANFVLDTASSLTFGTTIYLQNIPRDSNSSRKYYYLASPSDCNNTTTFCTSFTLCAKKEGTDISNDLAACSALSECGTEGNCDIGLSSQ